MRLSPGLGLLVKALDVGLELLAVHPPDPSSADLDGRKLTGSHECVDLRNRDAEIRGHIVEREKPRLKVAFPLWFLGRRHPSKIAPGRVGYVE